MKINLDIKLTKKQQEAYDILHDGGCQYLIARWSRQCGKTVLAEVVMLEYLIKQNTFNAYISPSYSQGRKVYSEMITLLSQTSLISKANASSLTIETVLGSKLQFFTMENPTAIRGYTITGVLVLDEAAFFPKELPDGTEPWGSIILPITKARKPKVLIISTPNGKQGLFYELYNRALLGEQGYRQISATIYDDELVTKEEIEEIKRSISPLAFAQEFEVEFLDSAITVFPGFERRFDLPKWQPTGRIWCGIDPSTVGDDNTIVTLINDKNEVHQIKVDGTLDDKYETIAKIINTYKPLHTYCESNSIGEVMANEIRKRLNDKAKFSTFATTNDSKKEYIGLLATAISNGSIHFEQDNKILYSELSTFTYKVTKTGKVTYAAKAGYHDDTVTSLGIALQCKEDRRTTSSFAFPTGSKLSLK